MTAPHPLVVDLDGSLLRTDSLHESIAAHLRHPSVLLRAAVTLRTGGRAAMKRALAAEGPPDLSAAPLNPAVVELIHRRASEGCEIVLATGADAEVARTIVRRIPGITRTISSDGSVNLTGPRKAAALMTEWGTRGFDYVGNSRADATVWDAAERAYLATTRPRGLPRWARTRVFSDVLRDPRPSHVKVWASAVRVHQSLKNLLLFLPLVAAHAVTTWDLLGRATAGFAAFTLMAWAVYLLNDILDMSADRAHATKHRRPVPAGWISPLTALAVSIALAVAALAVALALGLVFLGTLIVYAMLTTAYSMWLKRIAVIDIVVLALLYMVRIIAGAVATGIALSFWFTGVTLFLFLSLALVKRYAEAHQAGETGRLMRGRGYSGDDMPAILALGTSTGVASGLLLAIYIQSEAVSALYPAPAILWLVIPAYFAWIAHLWIMAGRGKMHDDPLVFAFKDPASLSTAAVMLVIFLLASLPVSAELIRGIIR